jgi:16S rRNA (uracil1498-N3)-methyltransferase
MLRRLHLPALTTGRLALPADEAHHARDVLRLETGTLVELFDDAGKVARGKLQLEADAIAFVLVESLHEAFDAGFALTIATAVPKGERADWMIEKLSELGVARLIPLATARSVVLPSGVGKRQRWERLAIESAKQSRRRGVLHIDPLTPLSEALTSGWYLSTDPAAVPLAQKLAELQEKELRLYVGPEGGWTDAECAAFDQSGLTGVKLTDTILRIETAAIAAAAMVLSRPCIRSHATPLLNGTPRER